MNWKDRRKRSITIEIIVIAIAIVILLIGCVCDVLVERGIIFHIVEDLNDVSLTLLQIQAAVTTLTLTIIALLSGNISDSYMGIPISMFYLEKRPFLLKQKAVILAEFLALALSIWGHIYGAYNLVIAFFMSSMILIVISILEIYEVFKGKRGTLEEVESYVRFLFENEKNYKDIGDAFIEDWKSIAQTQSKEEFDHYFQVFCVLIERILNCEKNIDDVNSYSENMALFLLEHESKGCRLKGLRLVRDFYDELWKWINNNKEQALNYNKTIALIDRISREWYCAMDSTDAEIFEKNLNFDSFSETVIRVASWIGFSNEKNNEIPALNSIARTLGGYIDKQNKKGNIVDIRCWERLVADRFGYGAYGIPEGRTEFYLKSMALRDFNICYGYLLRGQTDMILNGVFLDGINNVYKIDNAAYVLRVMLIHCFMYYLAFKESTDCIDAELQQKIRQLLLSREVTASIFGFYYHLGEGEVLLNEQVENQLEEILDRFELFPKHSNSKCMITNNIAKDYFLYVALMVESFEFKQDVLVDILNTQKYYVNLIDSNLVTLRKSFTEMHQIFISEELSEEDSIRKTDEMLSSFEIVMKEKYKKTIIEEAAANQREYEEKGLQSETANKVKEIIKENFEKTFADFQIPCKNSKTYSKVNIFTLTNFTRWLSDNIRGTYSEYSLSGFLRWLINELATNYGIEVVRRSERFESDESFREYLTANEFNVLLGSQYAFGCTDYMGYREHSDFIGNLKCDFISGINEGVALRTKTLFIKLNDVYVEIFSPNIDEENTTKNDETGLYSYSPTQGITLDFEKAELEEFLHNERKIVKIFVNVTIGVKEAGEDSRGVIIKRK